jgi:pyruvate dehydrogenase E2 component (dihydrolipoyllysine-residue acetyltransferase)
MAAITMPRLSDSMEEGTVVRWLKQDGDVVRRGEAIAEIETDKATLDFESDAPGALTIVLGAGETAPVGAVIAYVGEHEPAARPVDDGARVANGAGATLVATSRRARSASPMARRLAEAIGVDLGGVPGSGRHGRILKTDVRAAAERGGAPSTAIARAPTGGAPEPARPTAPAFWASIDVDMAAVLALREQLQDAADPAPSIDDLIVAAAARALRRHPPMNGCHRNGTFEPSDRVNVGVTVAAEGGLAVPTIVDADRASIGHLARETRRLAQRVRSGEVTPAELADATFTVSNLGMYGIDSFGALVDAPSSAVLCVGAVRDRAWAVDGALAVRPIATLTLVADHRVRPGADAAGFLATVARLLEQPLGMLL